jgi:hypothetical protein
MLEPWPQGLHIGFPNQFNGTVFQLLVPIEGHSNRNAGFGLNIGPNS